MDNLSPELIIRELSTHFIGQKVIFFSTTTSTMDVARREARWGAPAGTVVLADEQTAGRGRLERSWISPKGNLALSVILRPNLDYLPYLVMIASLAVVYSIEKVTGIKPQIKWPNDVFIKEKKVCGILIENDIRKNDLVYSIIGIGININLHIPDIPAIAPFATSLSEELGKTISRVEIAQQLLIEMERLYHVPQVELSMINGKVV
jgi:BirA family biotin operon repressor/biotin-[acetyl-CoA-carboxylase] ligase